MKEYIKRVRTTVENSWMDDGASLTSSAAVASGSGA